MSSDAKTKFDSNKTDVAQLWTLHEKAAGGGVGAKHGVEVLNRAAIVFINACWEAYIEDLVREALSHLKTIDAIDLPGHLKAAIGASLREDKSPQSPWLLADAGWKTVVDDYSEQVLYSFHTPKTKNVDSLYRHLIGLKELSLSWTWQKMSSKAATKKLDDYVSVRGGIVHRVKHGDAEKVYKSWGTDYLNHVERLVEATDSAVGIHLAKFIKRAPW